MHSEDKIRLLQDFLTGKISDSQLKELFFWLNSEKGNLEYERRFNDDWLKDFETQENIDSVKLFSKIEAKIKEKQFSRKKHFLIGLRNAAAIFILGLILPFIYYSTLTSSKEKHQVVYLKETLSSEKVKKITLADGTDVWLMSGSSISYPASFAENKTREVEVKGEAFFNVTKDSKHPFIVKLGAVGLKVIGTSFNVMNYGNEDQIQVVLKSGQVDLFEGDYNPEKPSVHLNPGQLATYEKNESKFFIKETDTNKYTSWTDGILLFHDDPLDVVLKKLGRWYNIDIEIDDPSISHFPFTATIKNENLDQIIDLLQYSTPFRFSKYKLNGESKIVVKRK